MDIVLFGFGERLVDVAGDGVGEVLFDGVGEAGGDSGRVGVVDGEGGTGGGPPGVVSGAAGLEVGPEGVSGVVGLDALGVAVGGGQADGGPPAIGGGFVGGGLAEGGGPGGVLADGVVGEVVAACGDGVGDAVEVVAEFGGDGVAVVERRRCGGPWERVGGVLDGLGALVPGELMSGFEGEVGEGAAGGEAVDEFGRVAPGVLPGFGGPGEGGPGLAGVGGVELEQAGLAFDVPGGVPPRKGGTISRYLKCIGFSFVVDRGLVLE